MIVDKIEPLMVRPKEAAELIGVSERTFHSMKSSGQLPPGIKIGGCLCYSVEILRQWVSMGCPTLEKFLAQKNDK